MKELTVIYQIWLLKLYNKLCIIGAAISRFALQLPLDTENTPHSEIVTKTVALENNKNTGMTDRHKLFCSLRLKVGF